MPDQPENQHVHASKVSKLSFQVGKRHIHIVRNDLPHEEPEQDPLPDPGPPPRPPIRIAIFLGGVEADSDLNLDEYVERANAEDRDLVIHIRGSRA